MSVTTALPRLRQAVLAARDLDGVAERLRSELGLGEPYSDPAVAYFGLRNAVFALGDTFLEIVSPVRADAPAARLLERRGEVCGYMVMAQVSDIEAARARARATGVREVFEVKLDDIAEVHLHPSDIGGAIVSLSQPAPPESWRWGGADWQARSAAPIVAGATLAVSEPRATAERWRSVIGELQGVAFVEDPADRGLVEIRLAGASAREPIDLGAVRLVWETRTSEQR